MSKENPLVKLAKYGQSIWLDYIRRGILESGELKQMIEEDGLRGVTVNPSILEKAISGSHDYSQAIEALALEGTEAPKIYERLAVEDVQRAADLFRPLYDRSEGKHGFVSLEVSPYLAHDTQATVDEARRFWKELDRPNVMIKVPATIEGLPAIRQLIAEGINVNVTLLFGLPRYREVAEAYIEGLETRLGQGMSIDRIASVASFFLSRIDVLVDPMLEKAISTGGSQAELAKKLHGQVAVASARNAYQIYKEIFNGPRFKRLAGESAQTQRLLWASTSTKNPDYSDVKYVEALIGPETVNTAPLETIHAYRDHGNPQPRIETDIEESRRVPDELHALNIDIDEVTSQLEKEGVKKFSVAYDRLIDSLNGSIQSAKEKPVDRMQIRFSHFVDDYEQELEKLENQAFVARLWRKDPGLWKSDPQVQKQISNSLGWLNVAEKMEENLSVLRDFREEVHRAGFRHVVHMGMGGSSLAPLVFERTFKPGKNGLPLSVLDTTDPATILKVEKEIPLEHTLFIVASKSGTTAEPLAFGDYFYYRLKEIKGEQAGENFIAITDPGTPLVKLAQKRKFRRVFLNYPDIGGRYSALSYFGLLPAALMDIDLTEFLARALRMLHACASCIPADENPGFQLGVFIGVLARRGRDKLTFLTQDSISSLGMWLEQLLAESTGKESNGILPVAGEPAGDPDDYGQDRLFVHLRLQERTDQALEKKAEALIKAGQPVITIKLEDHLDLAQEYFRWEFATAVAGAVLGINPFDQPNVQESKDNTNRLLELVEEKGALPVNKPDLVESPLSVFTSQARKDFSTTLEDFLLQAHTGDYLSLMAYLTETAANQQTLQEIRTRLRDRMKLATTLGYGPRFLHSTGQYHKGGPNNGLFIQLTADVKQDLPVPDRTYSFGTLKNAQAQGDFQALQKHGRRVIHVDLGPSAPAGLSALLNALEKIQSEIPVPV
jgi:transaldolase/glucose-6-phosphate isomerase